MAVQQAPLSLGFSRQEHWSGLPFPSPMHKSESEVAQSCPTLCDPMDCSPLCSSVHGDSPGKNTGVGCHFLIQCIKVKVKLLSRVQFFSIPWTVAHQAPLSMGILQAKILEWVATPSSRVSSQPRDQSYVSHITGRFFTIWATREATFIHSKFTATSRLLFDWMVTIAQPIWHSQRPHSWCGLCFHASLWLIQTLIHV